MNGRAFQGPFAFPHLRDVDPARTHRLVFYTAFVVYLITAWNSSGYHSADEHFQIIAFAQWKLGELPIEHLAWEFEAGIRSSFQPWVAVAVFKAAAALGVHDPFTRAFLLRALTALLALAAIRRSVNATLGGYHGAARSAYIVLAYGLWFIPFLSVRFSSEGWSAILLLHAITTVHAAPRTRHWALWAGIFAGLAILCRPPTGAIVSSIVAWSLLVRRDAWRSVLVLLGTTTAVILSGVLMDSLFYGRPTPSILNYLALGFQGDPAIRFDELPWWYYPPWIVKYAIPPIGALLLAAFALLLIKRPTHPIVWCALPYLLIHSMIPHKELRFLYPLAPLMPWMLMEAWRIAAPWMARLPLVLRQSTLALLILTNALGLAVVVASPAGEGRVRLARPLYQTAQPGEAIGYAVESGIAWRITLPGFYQPPGTREVIVPDHGPVEHPERLRYVIVQDGSPPPPLPGSTLVPIIGSMPPWCAWLMRWYTWGEGQAPWTLYHVRTAAEEAGGISAPALPSGT
jgi:phosphatidylinositol glycan class B